MAGFWLSYSDGTGTRIAGSEIELSPGPGRVEYPAEALGSIQETPDGAVVQQVPSQDPRRRAWAWLDYPEWLPEYLRLWQHLISLRSKRRFASGLSPFVFLRDNVTGRLNRRVDLNYVVSAASAANVTTASTLTTDNLAGGSLEVISGAGEGQTRYIISNSGNTIEVSPAWNVEPDSTSRIVVRYEVADWVRVRVLDVARKVSDNKTLRFDETKMTFVIDDPSWKVD